MEQLAIENVSGLLEKRGGRGLAPIITEPRMQIVI
jgi:hypothetical protein